MKRKVERDGDKEARDGGCLNAGSIFPAIKRGANPSLPTSLHSLKFSLLSFNIGSDTSTSSLSLHSLFSATGGWALSPWGGSGSCIFTAIAYGLRGAYVYIIGRREEELDEDVQDFEAKRSEVVRRNNNMEA